VYCVSSKCWSRTECVLSVSRGAYLRVGGGGGGGGWKMYCVCTVPEVCHSHYLKHTK
jgi:hypothetical protein